MTRTGTRAGRALFALLGVGILALVHPAPAAADSPTTTYEGSHFTADYRLSATRSESQHKIWFYAGSWWALMLEQTGRTERVFKLLPDHTWHPTSAVVDTDTGGIGDAVQEGNAVDVVTRTTAGALYSVHLTFDPAAGEYHAATPVMVTTRKSVAPAVIARDASGVLWIAYATAEGVIVTHSLDSGATWGRMMVIAPTGTGQTQEVAALVAYDNRMGIMWSDQKTQSFQFASHLNGDDPTIWTREQALAGAGMVDNHISLVHLRVPGQPSDTLVAAVKTSLGDHGEPPTSPSILILVRAPGGHWTSTPAATLADGLDNPVLQVDNATRSLRLFADHGGPIVTKVAPWTDLRFPAGVGTLFMSGVTGITLLDPTVTAAPVDADSGLVVLANDIRDNTYRHAEMPLGVPVTTSTGPDKTPPTAPGHVIARAVSANTAVISWSPSTDGTQWYPGADGVPVSTYLVLRDGKQIATVTTSTSFADQARPGSATGRPASVRYSVIAVDHAGNRSVAASSVANLPATPNRHTADVISLVLVGLATLAGGYGAWRTWAGRRIAAQDAVARRHAAGSPSLETLPDHEHAVAALSPDR